MTSDESRSARTPLTRERVLQAAIDLADRYGLDALTMRRLGADLGVEAMSLYKHVANKDEILDGIVELVVGEIEVPEEESDWKEGMRRRAMSARDVLGRHSWALGLFESRGAMGPALMRYVNAVLGNLRAAGFSIENAVHAFWMLDCYVYGQVLQEANLPFGSAAESAASEEPVPRDMTSSEYPHLIEVAEHALRFDYGVDSEFEFGLDLILDALEGSALPESLR